MHAAQQHDELHVTGTLADDAVLGFSAGADENRPAVLSFTIQPAKGLPYFVRQVIGTDVSAQIAARAKVREMRRGTVVTVYAKGCRFQSDHDQAGLRLLDVSDVVLSTPNAARAASLDA